MKVILLNGPPRSGKDTAGQFFRQYCGAHLEKFAQPIRDWACMFFDIDDHEIEYLKDVDMLGNGVTLRQWMIGYSEDFLKKHGGPRIFGELLINRITTWSPLLKVPEFIVITDSGFREEGEVVAEKVSSENVTLIQVHRPGCDFKGDSRSYIELPGIQPITIHNDGTVEDFQRRLNHIVQKNANTSLPESP